MNLPCRSARRKQPNVSGNPSFQKPATAHGKPNGDWEKRATEIEREKMSCAPFHACDRGVQYGGHECIVIRRKAVARARTLMWQQWMRRTCCALS